HRIRGVTEPDGLKVGPNIDPHARSVMICPLRQGPRVLGALWFASDAVDASAPEHQSLLDSIADLVTLGVQHDAIRTTEAVRRERLESLERLVHRYGGSGAVGQVLKQ